MGIGLLTVGLLSAVVTMVSFGIALGTNLERGHKDRAFRSGIAIFAGAICFLVCAGFFSLSLIDYGHFETLVACGKAL